jgi:hypothetical protein
MRRTSILAVAAVLTFAAPALAVKPTTTGKPKVTAVKSQAPKPQAAKAPKAPKAPKTMTASSATSSKGASAKPAKSAKTTTAAPTPTTPTTWTPTNPIAQKLSTKPNHLAKLQSVLPPGTDLNNATLGFKNFGQLNAAVNNSINHNIPFADLKAAMTGVRIDGTETGVAPVSLGQAKKQWQATQTTTSTSRAQR